MLKIGTKVKFISDDIIYWFKFYGWKENNFNEENKCLIIVDLFPSLVISIDTLNNQQTFIVGFLHPKQGIFYIEINGNKVCETNYYLKLI